MTYLKVLNVLIAVASLAFVLSLAWQLFKTRLPANRALVALVVVFALRTITRGLPPFGEDTAIAVGVFDTLLLLVMVILVVDGRKIVQAFNAQRQAAEQVQIEYDLALQQLDTQSTDDLADQLHLIQERAETALRSAGQPGSIEAALQQIAQQAKALRARTATDRS